MKKTILKMQYILIIGMTIMSTTNVATELRVAAWNIANLHHKENVELRPDIGTRRQEKDFNKLFSYAQALAPDIVALQEIGTKEGVQRIFPSKHFEIIMSSRYQDDINARKTGGIYTAIAVRRKEGIDILEQEDLKELQVDYDESGNKKVTRRGTAVLLKVDGTKLWFMSVHLKSGCADVKNPNSSKRKACKVFWKQKEPLRKWIEERLQEKAPFIIAGDFNRRFRKFNMQDTFLNHIDGQNESSPIIVLQPESDDATRQCPTRRGKSTQPIDWIMIHSDIASWINPDSYQETLFSSSDVKEHGSRLSDHCPIHIDLTS